MLCYSLDPDSDKNKNNHYSGKEIQECPYGYSKGVRVPQECSTGDILPGGSEVSYQIQSI